ncbi:unnamed protein product [Musa acuminata subsp. malaccensis]|uniref:(wild Malaysian banana) hypothetical protein n=1 Tax=Musa acuminata subsp. malaccensis TaxID=214687 RepID=A0A804IV51_MUSAM|nr:unnamed protein product [Musa acuminata subsp. malaccensis]
MDFSMHVTIRFLTFQCSIMASMLTVECGTRSAVLKNTATPAYPQL